MYLSHKTKNKLKLKIQRFDLIIIFSSSYNIYDMLVGYGYNKRKMKFCERKEKAN